VGRWVGGLAEIGARTVRMCRKSRGVEVWVSF